MSFPFLFSDQGIYSVVKLQVVLTLVLPLPSEATTRQ